MSEYEKLFNYYSFNNSIHNNNNDHYMWAKDIFCVFYCLLCFQIIFLHISIQFSNEILITTNSAWIILCIEVFFPQYPWLAATDYDWFVFVDVKMNHVRGAVSIRNMAQGSDPTSIGEIVNNKHCCRLKIFDFKI